MLILRGEGRVEIVDVLDVVVGICYFLRCIFFIFWRERLGVDGLLRF